MKKVLILAYDFTPNPSVGGQRPAAWAKHLPEHGILPVVVTRHWDRPLNESRDTVRPSKAREVSREKMGQAEIIRVPFTPNLRDRILLRYGDSKRVNLRKAWSLFYAVAPFFSLRFDEKAGIYRPAREELKKGDFDLILATGEPFILFRYAALLSKEFGVPWVADYRDGWSGNYTLRQSSRVRKILFDRFYKKREEKLLQGAKAIISVSDALSKELGTLLKREVIVLPNGYSERFEEEKPEKGEKNARFTLAYAGSLYDHQRVEVFLDGFALFINRHSFTPEEVRVCFYGLDYNAVQLKRVLKYSPKLAPFFETTPRLAQGELIEELKKAHVFLLFANEEIDGSAMKMYDYIALEKQVLVAVNDHGSIEKIVKETGNGVLCDTTEEVCSALERYYDEFKKTGDVLCEILNKEKYSRKHTVKQLAVIIEGICAE